MSPTRNSKVRGVRVLDRDYELAMKKASRKGWTFNRWVNWAIRLGLRNHHRSGGAGKEVSK